MDTPEKIMKEAIEKAAMVALKEAGTSSTYAAEAASGHFGDGVKIDLLALNFSNEIRRMMGMPIKSVFETDGIGEETLGEYLRRAQG